MGKKVSIALTFDLSELEVIIAALNPQLAPAPEEDQEDDDARSAPKKKPTKKAPAKFEEEDEDEVDSSEDDEADEDGDEAASTESDTSDDDDDDEPEAEDKPAPKGKKLTAEDVNDACKKKVHAFIDKGVAGPDARQRVLALLKKKFGVKSISALKPAQYAAVLKALA